MPYQTNQDLKESVRKHLPEHAQSIFRKAFNNAFEQYHNEHSAFKVAWNAVKRSYKKNESGAFVEKKSTE